MNVKIIGGGYGGVRTALDLDRRLRGRRGVRITLIDKQPYHQLITELHKPAAGGSAVEAAAIPLSDIFSGTGVRVLTAAVTDICVGRHRIELQGRRLVKFDRLVVALGSEPEYFSIPGVKQHCLTIQGLNSARHIRQHIETMFAKARSITAERERRPYLTIVVMGGGFTGVEFAGELADRMPTLARKFGLSPRDVRIITIEAAPDILPGFDEPLVDAAVETLVKKGVTLMMGSPIVEVGSGFVALKDGYRVDAQTMIWTGGVRAHGLVEQSFSTRARGRAIVNEYLQSVDDPNIYVVGDAALAINPKTGQPVAPTAQNAVEQGRVAARNIWAEITGRSLTAYTAKTLAVVATVGRDVGLTRIGPYKLAGRFPAVVKDLSTLRYIYSLGGSRLLLKFLYRNIPGVPVRA